MQWSLRVGDVSSLDVKEGGIEARQGLDTYTRILVPSIDE